jgi:hypothetical protein
MRPEATMHNTLNGVYSNLICLKYLLQQYIAVVILIMHIGMHKKEILSLPGKERKALRKLIQKPILCLILKCIAYPFYKMISINTSVNKVVNVGALISSCKEIVQPPEVNVSFPVSAKAVVLVIIFYYRGYLVFP